MKQGLKLSDILVTIIIAIAFGIVYILWSPVMSVLTPLGLQINQLVYGMWFIAGVVAYLVVRKPGVALIAEIAAASGEFILGSPYGLSVLIYGVAQGLFAELVFMAFKYKRFDMNVAMLAGFASGIGSFVMDIMYGELASLSTWNLTLMIVFRLIGSIVFAGILAHMLVRVLEMTGVTNLVRPVAKSEYNDLDKD